MTQPGKQAMQKGRGRWALVSHPSLPGPHQWEKNRGWGLEVWGSETHFSVALCKSISSLDFGLAIS